MWMRVGGVGVALIGFGAFRSLVGVGATGTDALVLALCGPLTIVHLVGGAHNEALMAGLMMVGLAVGLRARSAYAVRALAGAALIGLGAAVKLPAIVSRGLPRLVPGRRGCRVVAASGGRGRASRRGAGGDRSRVSGDRTRLGLGARRHRRLVGDDHVVDEHRPGARCVVAGRAATPGTSFPAIANGVRTFVELASFVGAAVLVWRSPRLGVRALGFALLLVGLLGPAVHPWYAVWGFVVLAATEAGKTAWWLTVGAAVVSAMTQSSGGGGSPQPRPIPAPRAGGLRAGDRRRPAPPPPPPPPPGFRQLIR